jgi:branched-chain amino acid transport system permease protein
MTVPRILAAVCLLIFLALPSILGVFYLNFVSQALIAAVCAIGINLMLGYGGLITLGHGAFLGVAAYFVAGLTVNYGFGHLAAVLIAISVTTVIAGVFGLIALRAEGLSFLMITLALGQILWGIAYRWVAVTGGENGITRVRRPVPFGFDLTNDTAFYYFVLAISVVTLVCVGLFVNSPLGTSLKGTRDQPKRMSALGHNVWLIRWITYTLAGFCCAIAGVLYIYFNLFISPHALALVNSAEYVLMVIVGGAGTLIGPIVGAFLVLGLKNIVSSYVAHWVTLLGVVFVLVMLFVPEGLVPGFVRLMRGPRWREKQTKEETFAATPKELVE